MANDIKLLNPKKYTVKKDVFDNLRSMK